VKEEKEETEKRTYGSSSREMQRVAMSSAVSMGRSLPLARMSFSSMWSQKASPSRRCGPPLTIGGDVAELGVALLAVLRVLLVGRGGDLVLLG